MPGDEYFANGGVVKGSHPMSDTVPAWLHREYVVHHGYIVGFVKWTEVKRKMREVQRTASLDYLFDQRD
jgi:hypothetical protein